MSIYHDSRKVLVCQRENMVPPIFFIQHLIHFLNTFFNFFFDSDNDVNDNNDVIIMSFMHIFQIILMLNSFLEIYCQNIFDDNREWDAHQIITYLMGYR